MNDIASLGPMESLSAMENILDKLADASGRNRCGYICLLSEIIDHLKTFVVIEGPAEVQEAEKKDIKEDIPVEAIEAVEE